MSDQFVGVSVFMNRRKILFRPNFFRYCFKLLLVERAKLESTFSCNEVPSPPHREECSWCPHSLYRGAMDISFMGASQLFTDVLLPSVW